MTGDTATAIAAAEKKADRSRDCSSQRHMPRWLTPTTEYQPLGEAYPATSTGRRLAFARWMTSRNNPLAARVAVNHIWLRHFGAPLVDNVFDFGLRSRSRAIAAARLAGRRADGARLEA